ncbi:hypothetical protein [Kiloniella sp.]|uniref:hypothetical protein n=1 Tax=Kiloniella sp. TaxID=1938587 RepID=UPI003B023CD1
MKKDSRLSESNIDFDAINKRLMNEKPRLLSKAEVMARLHKGLSKALDNGLSYEHIVEILHKDYNISVAVSSLRKAIAVGKMSGKINREKAEEAANDLTK